MIKVIILIMGFYSTFASNLNANVSRRSIDDCAVWAEKYRMIQPKKGPVDARPFEFTYYPWLREMHQSKAERNVGQKAAQMGYTELLINWIFFNMDIHKASCLYVLPTDDNANDFSSARFDPAIEASQHLTDLYSDIKNKSHKRAGLASLYIRGSRAKNKLISIPVGKIAIDELDQMVQEHIDLIWERMSGQFEKQSWSISTPTVEGYGINKMFIHTTEEHLFFPCPHCSRLIELTEDNLEICGESQDDPDYKRSRLFCGACKHTLRQEDKYQYLEPAKFVTAKDNPDYDNRGFYVPQFYSSTISAAEIALTALKGLEDENAERELWNSKYGKPHVPKSYRISSEDIEACKSNYVLGDKADSNSFVTIGIDIGTRIHYEIDEWTLDPYLDISDNSFRVLMVGSVEHFEELDDIIKDYHVNYGVVDANPERRASVALCKRHKGFFRYCFYGIAKMDREISPDLLKPFVSVNRAMWIDLTVQKFKNGTMKIPANISIEYSNHVKANVKIVKEDSNGNIVFKYDNLGIPDHLHHARVYNEIALACAFHGGVNTDIKDKV